MSAPTGTIFELDVFCDQMFRLADERFSAERHDELLRELAAELRGLIDNVQAQYCPSAPPSDEGEPVICQVCGEYLHDCKAHDYPANPFNHPDVRRLVEAAEKLPAMFTALHSTEPIDPDEYRAAVCTDAAQIADEIAAALTPIQENGENNNAN